MLRILAAIPLTLVLLATSALAADRRPITHEDVWLMKRLGAPQLSPDGRQVIVTVTEPTYDERGATVDLWLATTDGSQAPRRLTATRGGETGVTWSPDGRKIAFAARREGDEVDQVYVLDLAGGEAQRVTSLSTGARAPKFSPDGTKLAFLSMVFRGASSEADNVKAAQDLKSRKYEARAYDGFPIRSWDRWLDEREPHVFVQDARPGATARDLLAGTKLVAEPGFSGRPVDTGPEVDITWAPDGDTVLFVASTDRNTAARAFTSTDVFAVPTTGGEPRRVTNGGGTWSQPRFGAGGRTLYALLEPISGRIYNETRLSALPWPAAGQPRVLTAAWDRSVTSYVPSADGRKVYLLAEEAGHEKLFEMPAGGGDVRLVYDMTSGVYYSLAGASAAPTLVALFDSAVSPPELVAIDVKARRHRALTQFNASRAAEIDWQPAQAFWITSSRGKRIHSLLVLPPAFDPTKKYPLFVMMHGGPHTMFRDQFVVRWNYHLLGAPGYVMLMTNYSGSTGFGEEFARSIQGDPFVGPASEINEAADAAIAQFPFIDGTRQAAAGASYGGHLANWLQASTTRYRALVSHAGLINLEAQWGTSDSVYGREVTFGGPPWTDPARWAEQNPIRYADRFRTPTLVTIGEKDYRVPLNNALEYWTALQRQQVPSRLVVFPNENHWILKGENSRYFYQEIHGWLAKWLTPQTVAAQ